MMKINWGQMTGGRQSPSTQTTVSTGNFITITESEKYSASDQSPTQDARSMCRALKLNKLAEYLGWLERKPKEKIISKFLGIINSKSTGLPILSDDEVPDIVIDHVSFNPTQNIQARMLTKITLLLLIKSESSKLGIWNELQSQWKEQYIRETKRYVQILEAIRAQCENLREDDKAKEIKNSIKLIREANIQYEINWEER